jgi:hypothetical protein
LRGWLSRKTTQDVGTEPGAGDVHLALARESLKELLQDTRVPAQVRAQLARDYDEVRDMLEKLEHAMCISPPLAVSGSASRLC